MPPPQQLLSSAVSIVPKKWLNPTFLVLLVFLVVALPLSSPSESTSVRASRKSTKWAHWSVRSEEICPSAKGWVTHPGSFCETLWNSPYLSNRTELEARERRAIQFYCEMDSILDRFDCAQEYSVNVRRGQCKLCREAYREWACAMITDTLEDGQLDCETKLMPCPSCASICHQVMRLCPYLSPDRNQADRKGQITPQTSQYGGHPAFYCPLENDDPSDPAYTSLCFHQSPFSTSDPDYIHNICTNPPIHLHQDPPDLNHPLRYNNKPKDYYFYSRGKGGGRTGRTAKGASDHFYSPRSSSSASSVNYFNDRAEYNSGETFNSYSVGGGVGGGAADENGAFTHSSGSSDAYGDEEEEPPEDDDWVSAMPHYTSCCWTYASSVVNFLPAQDFPEYGSDTYFMDAGTSSSSSSSTAATFFTTFTTTTPNTTPLSSAHSPRSRDSPTLRNNKDSYVNNGSVVDEGGRGGGSTPTTSPTKPSSISDNRVILNCCDSRGVCNSRDPFDVSQEEEEDELTTEQQSREESVKKGGDEGEGNKKTRRSGKSEEVVALSSPLKDNKQSPSSHKRSGGQQTDDSSTSASFYFPGEESPSRSVGGGGGVQAFDLKGGGGGGGGGELGPEEEFFRSEEGVRSVLKPTHRPGGDGGVDYDEHYVDTEPDGDGGSSSTELEDDEIFEPPGYSAVDSSGTSESEWGEKPRRTSRGDGGKHQGESLVNSKDKLKTSYLSSSSSSFSDSSFFSSSSSSSYPGGMFNGKSGGESESKRSFVEIVMGDGGSRGDVDRDHGQTSSGSDDDSRTAPDLHFVSFDNEEMMVVGDGGRRRATTSEESSGSGGVVVGDGEGQGGLRRPTWSDPWPGSLTVPSSSSSSLSSASGSSTCSWSHRPRRQSPPRTYLAKVLYRISTDCCHLFVMLLIALLCLTLTNFLPVFLLNLEDGVVGGCEGGGQITLEKSSNFVTTESGSSEGVSSTCSSNSNRHSRRNEHFERVKKAVVLEDDDSSTCKMSGDDSSRKYYDDIKSREVWAAVVSRRISRKKIHGDEAYSDNWSHIYSSRDLREKYSDECNYYYEYVRRRGVFLMFMNAVLINMMSYLKSSRGASLTRLDLTIKLGYYHYYYCYCYFYLSLRNYENDDRGDSSSKLLADLYCYKVFKLLIHLLVCERLSERAGQTSLDLMWGSSQHNYCYYQAVITIRYYSCTTTSVLNCSGCYFYVIPLPWLSINYYVASSRRGEEVLTFEDLNNKGMSPLSLVGTSNHNTQNFTGKVGGESCKPIVFDVCPVKILCIVSFITKPLPTLSSRTSGRQKTSHDRVSQCFPNKADVSYCKRRFRKMQAITRGDGYFQSFNGTFPSEVITHCGRVGAVGNFDLDNRTPSKETWERPFLRGGERVSIGRCDDFCTVLEKVCSCRRGGDGVLTDERFPDYVIPWKLQTVCRESGHLVCKSKQSEHFHGQSIYGQDEEEDDGEVEDGGVFTSLNKVTIPHYSSICSRSKGGEGERRMCRLSNPLLLSIDNNYYRIIKYYLKTCRWFCSKGHEGCWVGIVFVNVILFYDARCSLPGSGSLTRISQWTVSETSTTKSSCNNYGNLLSVNDKRIIIGFLLMNLLILRRCFTLFFYFGGFASFPPKSHSYKRLHLYAIAQPLCNIISMNFRLLST